MAVTVSGIPHADSCLTARFREEAESGGDGYFPWCTCPRDDQGQRIPVRA
jgi:hypothetical protein